MKKIEEWAKAIQKHEGYIAPNADYPKGSRSYRNNNPGNFRCSLLVMGELKAIRCDDGFAVFPDYATGWKALVQFLTYAADGSLRAYKPEMTLYEFYAVYAPSTDGNYPRGYAEAVASDLGIAPTTKIKDLLGEVFPDPVTSQIERYHRYGHLQSIDVKLGDKVKAGHKIGENGTGNGQWPAHLHYDCPTKVLKNWTGYVFGWTKDEVSKAYADPKQWRMIVAPWFDHLGYEYLEHANYGTAAAPKWCYHPGEDLNGKGSGNSDLGMPVFSATDGIVVHCDDVKTANGGWGKLLVIQEEKEVEKVEEVVVPVQDTPLAGSVTTIPPEEVYQWDESVQEPKPMTFFEIVKWFFELIFKKK